MVMGLKWTKSPTEVFVPAYDAYIDKLVLAVEELVRSAMPEIDEWMKAEAVWRDRTGNARRSLHTELMREGLVIALVMQYTTPIFYSQYLETMQSGRFSILGPALDHWTPILFARLQRMLGK